MNHIFLSIGIMIIVATIFAYIARLTKQPLIPAYVMTGLILGPITGLITSQEVITTLSEIGIAILLFIVGLEIDMKKLNEVGLVAPVGGLIRVILMFTSGFLIAIFMGLIGLEAIYVGIIIAFSSTMVVVKLLSDKRELETLHGRIAIGILLLEDFAAVTAMSVLSTINKGSFSVLLFSLLKGVGIIVLAFVLSKYIFPKMFKFAAKNSEFLFFPSIKAFNSFILISLLVFIVFLISSSTVSVRPFFPILKIGSKLFDFSFNFFLSILSSHLTINMVLF